MRVSMSTIAASAVTTLFGFLALSFMQFQIGADLGLNLAKGIIFSFITVITFLPALAVLLMPLIDRTQHRKLMPDFSNIGAHIAKIRIPVLVVVLILVVFA
jgi:predicted RND superfamily exporter protein